MQCLEVSGAVRLIYRSLGVKGLKYIYFGGTVLDVYFNAVLHYTTRFSVTCVDLRTNSDYFPIQH